MMETGVLQMLVVLMLVANLDLALTQSSPVGKFAVQEELPPGTLVASIISETGLDQDYDKETLSKFRFQFLTEPDLDKKYFFINELTGMIKTTNILDRDKLCPQQDECIIKFDIAVQPIEYFQLIKIQVTVLDINDNAPTFPQRTLSLDISESAVPGTSFVIPPAYDPDSTFNGIYKYELVPSGGKFNLQERRTADGTTDLRLVLKERLDRETIDHDKVYIMVYDGGKPPKTGSIAIDISILDANDNDPHFENSTYEVNVRENLPRGTTVMRVRAKDADSGNNGRIVYQFSKHTLQQHGSIFGINEETGEIYVKGTLNYEDGSIYLLSLIAHDKGPDSLPSHATAIVRVEDVNDNAPKIAVNTLTTNGDAQVLENSRLNTFVAHISVIDEDSNKNGKFTCSIDNTLFTLQKLYLTEYKIVTNAVFDREERDEYMVSLVCKDKGINPQISIADIKVWIIDDNDHTPEFSETPYHITMKENNAVDHTILQVNATDKDSGPNGHVQYSMDARAQDILSIDPETGIITAKVILDYEEVHSLDFDIIAADKGDPPNTATRPLHIAIIDLDDERPTFTKDRYNFGVFENQGPNTQVGQVEAIDKDSEPFDKFRFHLDRNSVSADLFRIDPKEGTIYTTKALDREGQEQHYIVAVVTPLDDPTYSSTASVTVLVADKNDNPPVFDFPTTYNYTKVFSGKTPALYVITRLVAHDYDKSNNARLTYAITDGNEADIFKIDAISGAISAKKDLSRLADKLAYRLKVQVQDGGNPPMTDLADLKLIIDQNMPFRLRSTNGFLSEENLTIVLAFALATIFVAIIIIVAIVIIIRRSKNVRNTAEGQPKEKQHMLGHVPNDDRDHAIRDKPITNNYVSIDELDHRTKTDGVYPNHVTNHVKNHYGATTGYKRELRSHEDQRLTKELCEETVLKPEGATNGEMRYSPRTPVRSRSYQPEAECPSSMATTSCRQGNLQSSWNCLDDVTQKTRPLTVSSREREAACPAYVDRELECLSVGSTSNSDSGRGHSSEEGEAGRQQGAAGKNNDPDQIKTLVHQLHLRKKQLKDMSVVPLPPAARVKVGGTLPKSHEGQDCSGLHENLAHNLPVRCKASSPVTRDKQAGPAPPNQISAHGSYTLPRHHKINDGTYSEQTSSNIHNRSCYHRNGHRRSRSRSSLDRCDLDSLGSGDYLYASVDSIV